MKAAKWLNKSAMVLVLCLLVATFILSPLGVMPVNADSGSNGQPGTPPDTTQKMPAVSDPVAADEPLITTSLYLTALSFITF